MLRLLSVLWLVPSVALAQNQEAPAAERAAEGEPSGPEITGVDAPALDQQHQEPGLPIYEAWWFWVGIGAIVLGVTLAITVDLTTADPAPGDTGAVTMTLRY